MVAEESSIVMVPVPVDRLMEVYRVLGSSVADADPMDTMPSGSWSARDISRLHQELGPATAARAILDLGSAQPGQRVWFGDVCARVGRSHASVRSELGGFTKLINRRFDRTDWPFGVVWEGNRALYTVDDNVARAWLSASDQEKERAGGVA